MMMYKIIIIIKTNWKELLNAEYILTRAPPYKCKVKKGHSSCKMHDRVIVLVLSRPLMMVNKCMEFETKSLNTLGEKLTQTQNLIK